jgi:hypothetical protein
VEETHWKFTFDPSVATFDCVKEPATAGVSDNIFPDGAVDEAANVNPTDLRGPATKLGLTNTL